MVGSRLRPIGAEQVIPPGQVEAEIAVGLAYDDRMMHPVHIRRHNDPAQHSVEPGRHAHVAVDVALSSISKASTAAAGAPNAVTVPSLLHIESRISIG